MAFRNRIACYICDAAMAPRQMVHIHGNEVTCDISIVRREAEGRLPLIINDQTRICINCNQSIVNELRELERDPTCLRLNVLKQTSSETCVICNSPPPNIQRVSMAFRVNVFVSINIYVSENTKVCPHHLSDKGLLLPIFTQGLQFIERPYVIKGPQLSLFLQELRNTCTRGSERFRDETNFTDEDFKTSTSITKEQFLVLFEYCQPIEAQTGRRYVTKTDLLMFLCKLRHGLSDCFLAVIFYYSSRQTVSDRIALVRRTLMQHFVPLNIGFNSITREDYIQRHVTDFANMLYNSEPNVPKAICYIDGTYSKIEKSSNYRVLRQSFCIHKGYHLVKPVLIVAPDGFILDIQGPYFSDGRNNDAQLLRNEFERDVHGIREWLQEDDILIVDRGYRDVTEFLERLGIKYHMPALLQRGQRQLSTEESNSSRLVSKTRWIVEARNGHIKSMFRFFSETIPTAHVHNLGDFYRIAGALINKFHEPVLMQGANAELAREMLEKSNEVNVVKARVEIDTLHTRNARWVTLNENHLPEFPRLTLHYLRDLTIGVYQVKLAPSYVQDKLQREETDVYEFDELREDPFLLRFRIFSRFRNATKYQLWIVYSLGDDGPIVGYYCTCKSGARTLGTCAHVASVLWFLGYARHEEYVKYPSMSLFNAILDAGHRGPQINPS